jgi:flagellin-specific chaperone FliS
MILENVAETLEENSVFFLQKENLRLRARIVQLQMLGERMIQDLKDAKRFIQVEECILKGKKRDEKQTENIQDILLTLQVVEDSGLMENFE